MLAAQTSGAQVKALFLAIYSDGSRVDIGSPAPVGPAFGMAYVMTE
jgi:hypothetical protein